VNSLDTKRLAYRIIYQLVQNYVDSGRLSEWPECDSDKLHDAFKEIQDEMYRRGEAR